RRTISGATTTVSLADVCERRSRRPDERPGGRGPACPRVRHLSPDPSRAEAHNRDDDPPRAHPRARDRRPLVCGAVSALRLDLHHVVHRRRKHRTVYGGLRRRTATRSVVLSPGCLQRFLSVVAVPVWGGGVM